MPDTVELSTLGATIKEIYEEQPNTNALTDADKALLTELPTELSKAIQSVPTGIAGAIKIESLLMISQTNYDLLAPEVVTANNFLIFEE